MTALAITPSRLTLARQRRAMSQSELARRCELTPRSIGAYESGTMLPSPETAARLARELRFPLEFLTAAEIVRPTVSSASFRSLRRLTAGRRDAALAAGAIAIELSAWIRNRFELPPVNLPSLLDIDPEAAAAETRRAWALGSEPAPNMVQLLEAHGVGAFSLVEDCRDLDAFSGWFNRLPFVFINTKKTPEHARFDAAHELGHLVLHRDRSPALGNDFEQAANDFAAAFLMPADDVVAHRNHLLTIDSMIRVKRRWNVSLAAVAHRAFRLRLLTEWHYRAIFIEIAKRGFRTAEPNGIDRETSSLLPKVAAALKADHKSLQDIADDLHVPAREILALTFSAVRLSDDDWR